MQRLQTWFLKEHRKVEKGNDKLINRLAEARDRDNRPQRINDVQMFMKLYWGSMIKPVAHAQIQKDQNEYLSWLEDHPNATEEDKKKKKAVNIAICTKVVKKLWEEQDEEFRKEIWDKASSEHKRQMDNWEKQKIVGRDSSKKTALEWGMSLQKWGPEASRIRCAVGEEIGMVRITVYAGPNPWNKGRVNLFLTPLGKGPSGLTWPQFNPEGYEAFHTSMISFAKTIYPSSVRAARSIHQSDQAGSDLQVWGTKDPTRLDEEHNGEDEDEDEDEDDVPQRAAPQRCVHTGAGTGKKDNQTVASKRKRTKEGNGIQAGEEGSRRKKGTNSHGKDTRSSSAKGPSKSVPTQLAEPTTPTSSAPQTNAPIISTSAVPKVRASNTSTLTPPADATPTSDPTTSTVPDIRTLTHASTTNSPVQAPCPAKPALQSGDGSSAVPVQNVLGPREAVKAEGWIMVYKYALNPEGNMAELMDKLKELLEDHFEDDDWSKIVQAATDEEGNNLAAAKRIIGLAPSFVTFPQCADNHRDRASPEADGGSRGQCGVNAEGDGEDDEEPSGGAKSQSDGKDDDDGEDDGKNGEEDVLTYNPAQASSIWNHPNCEWWAPWVRDAMRCWKRNFTEYEIDLDDMWATYWQELIEVWLDHEDEFGNPDQCGEIISSFELGWIEEWRGKNLRPALVECDDEFEGLQEALKDVQKWWGDVCPEEAQEEAPRSKKGKEKESVIDFTPLDQTAGKDGFYVFIVAVTCLVVRAHQVAVNPTHLLRTWMAEWVLLVREMKDVMVKVQERGLLSSKKDKGNKKDNRNKKGKGKEQGGKKKGQISKSKRKRDEVETDDDPEDESDGETPPPRVTGA
ncbi:hypothetical protein VKT23_012327 [Stygiomarasmius scandens]|uniref:Transposase n=1 Tax=Marasmiellus scandens TaxID=2682957 RepID=A0ABR1JBB7_9AGAR